MGRPEVLQRFRPKRISQGRYDEPGRKAVRRRQGGAARSPFKSHRDGIADGDQKREFIYVDDAVAVVRWLVDTPTVSGLFNVGSGTARSFRDLVAAMFRALGREPDIEYIDMPPAIRDRYQYFTESKVEKLRRAGYNGGWTPLEEAVALYVSRFLDRPDRYR